MNNTEAGRESRYNYLTGVEYVYLVDGTEYRSDRFSIQLTDHKTSGAAEEDLVLFPVGGQIAVYYDPEDPGSSVLRPGASLGNITITFSVGAGMIVVGGRYHAPATKGITLREIFSH